MHHAGQGGPQAYAGARRGFGRAAAQGNAEAQVNLGFLYANGRGVRQDYALARDSAATEI